jgi:hypothetical protein
MTQITVTDELAKQIAGADLPIVLVDGAGRLLGQLNQFESEPRPPQSLSPEAWAEIVRRAQNPGEYSTLEEIKSRHGWADGR